MRRWPWLVGVAVLYLGIVTLMYAVQDTETGHAVEMGARP